MFNKELFLSLKKYRQEAADILERPSLRGVKYSVVEKYSEQAHFVYELLQNADDVKATKVKFILKKNGLIFIHNGKIKFNITDPKLEVEEQNSIGHINAITSIGNSSKNKSQIGKFGIGFKSVFQYTNNPEIYEDDYKFYIKRFIVPFLKENDHILRKKGETLFFFPFNNPKMPPRQAYIDISAKFEELKNPLLFIQSLKIIRWETLQNDGSYSIQLSDPKKWNQIKIDSLTSFEEKNNITDKSHFLRFTEPIKSSKHLVSITFPIDSQNNIRLDKIYEAYCFFPTKETTNLKFIIQAPFLLIDNRQGIKRGATWNNLLLDALSNLLIKSIDYFKENNLIHDDWFNILPIESNLFEDTLFYPFYEKTRIALREKAVLPTKEKTLISRENVFIAANERLLHLLTSKQLSALLETEAHWVFPSLAGARRRKDLLGVYLFDEIEIGEFTPRLLIKYISKTFLSEQTDEWIKNFYQYIYAIPNLWSELRKKTIIRTIKNDHLTPFNDSNELIVFLPGKAPTRFPVVKPIFIQDEIALSLFKNLGLKEADLGAEIELSIIPIYKKKEDISKEDNFEHVKMFIEYFKNASFYDQNNFISKIKNLPIIPVMDSSTNKTCFVRANVAYVSNTDLIDYFEGYKEKVFWIAPNFFKKLLTIYDPFLIKSFFSKLGALDIPRQIPSPQIPTSQNKTKYGISSNIKATEEYFITDYKIEGLENAIDKQNLTLKKSVYIWGFLVKYISLNLLKDKGEYKYFYFTHKTTSFVSTFLKMLKRRAWLYKAQNSSFFSTKKITIFDLSQNGYSVNSDASQKLIKLLLIEEEDFSVANLDLSDEEKILDLMKKAQKYEEFEDFIINIPKIKLEQLLKEQQIIEKKKQLSNNTIKEIEVDSNKIISKEDLLLNINTILTLPQNMTGGDIKHLLKKQVFELDNLHKKLESNILVENKEQKILYANLMNLRDFSIELSHVIKTALSRVMNQALFFKEEYPNNLYEEVFLSYSQEMHYELQRLRRIVDFMLSYTDAEKYYDTFDITSMINYLFGVLHKKDIEHENIHIELSLEDSLSLFYNKKSFEDIISNLITNSIKALKGISNKKIRCSTFINSDSKEFIIQFSDNGLGVDEKIKNKIFEAYITTTQQYGGAGVGLYIVKMKLQSLGGYIDLAEKSEFSEGATFKIALPID